MEDEKAGLPAYLLMASGALAVLYSLVYLLWTGITVVWGGVPMVSSIMEGGSVGEAAGVGAVMMAVPCIQVLGFMVTVVLGGLTLFGGLRLNNWESKGVVVLAVVASTAGPMFALVVNALSAANLGACGVGCLTGCLLGNIPTVVLLILGVVATVFGVLTLMDDSAKEKFAATS